jgi:predicted HTH transcriptional regulator
MIYKELETIEFKKSTAELKEAVISIVAMLNKHGQEEVCFGIDDCSGNEVAIFKDRVDVYNPGAFPDELAPEDFIRGDGYSILRNPLIAETMYLSADIEKRASGLKRIYDECAAAGIKVEFKRVKTGFVVSFHRPKWEEGEGIEKGG